MHVVHHAVKVNTFFLFDLQAVEEKVHQEGLAAPDTTPDVQTFDAVRILPGCCTEKTQYFPTGRLVVLDASLQVFEPLDDLELCRITDMSCTREAVLICLANIQSTALPVFSTLLQPGSPPVLLLLAG